MPKQRTIPEETLTDAIADSLAACKRADPLLVVGATIAIDADFIWRCLTELQERRQQLIEARPYIESVIIDLECESDPEYEYTEAQRSIGRQIQEAKDFLAQLPSKEIHCDGEGN